jgi:hypothetical protein
MAFDVLFRFWPPAPEPRIAANSRSRSWSRSSTSVGSGSTATVTVLVWTRPLLAPCQRWPPGSFSNAGHAAAPWTRKTASPGRSSTRSISKAPPRAPADVDRQLLGHQGLRMVTAFCGANFNDAAHCKSLPWLCLQSATRAKWSLATVPYYYRRRRRRGRMSQNM